MGFANSKPYELVSEGAAWSKTIDVRLFFNNKRNIGKLEICQQDTW